MTVSVAPQRLHHVAYITWDTEKTVDFYTRIMKMLLVGTVTADVVPSTKEPHPYLHTFFKTDNGELIAFFELLGLPEEKDVTVVPAWVRHLALRVPDYETLLRWKEHLEANGIEVLGPIDHGICHSIYFFDPNGIRLELASDVRGFTDEDARQAPAVVAAWRERARQHARSGAREKRFAKPEPPPTGTL
jgi:catechol 2,3-dioxygenase-like lactoylglutathione lyase family enzyme